MAFDDREWAETSLRQFSRTIDDAEVGSIEPNEIPFREGPRLAAFSVVVCFCGELGRSQSFVRTFSHGGHLFAEFSASRIPRSGNVIGVAFPGV